MRSDSRGTYRCSAPSSAISPAPWQWTCHERLGFQSMGHATLAHVTYATPMCNENLAHVTYATPMCNAKLPQVTYGPEDPEVHAVHACLATRSEWRQRHCSVRNGSQWEKNTLFPASGLPSYSSHRSQLPAHTFFFTHLQARKEQSLIGPPLHRTIWHMTSDRGSQRSRALRVAKEFFLCACQGVVGCS